MSDFVTQTFCYRMNGKTWTKQMIISAFFLLAIVCWTAFFINFILIYYHASRAIPLSTMVAVSCICLFVILPLTLAVNIRITYTDNKLDKYLK